MNVTLPAAQIYYGNNIPNCMVACKQSYGSSVRLEFKNLCAVVKIPIYWPGSQGGANAQVTRMEISSTQSLSGAAAVSWNGGDPTMVVSGGSRTMGLTLSTPVALRSIPDTFTVMLPPGQQTLTVKVWDGRGGDKFATKTLTETDFQRNTIYVAPAWDFSTH